MIEKTKKLHGWAQMAKASGWSVSQMRLFEKEGLVIHREGKGGKNVVWCYQKDLETFLKDRKPYQPKALEPQNTDHEKMDSPKLKGLWVTASISFILLGLIGLRIYQLWAAPKPLDDFFRYETQVDGEGFVTRLDLITRKGLKQNVWNPIKVKEKSAHVYTEESIISENMIQFLPKTFEYPAILAQHACLGLPTITSKGQYTLPSLSSFGKILGNGKKIQDMYYGSSIQFLDDGFFQGWMVYIKSQGDFLSAIILLDRQFKVLSTIYHPGHIRGIVHFNQYLAVSASLNAREDPKSRYRNSMFALHLTDILTQSESQVLPFSETTIPTEARRLYYQVAQCPPVQAVIYYSGLPGFTRSHLHVYRNEFNLDEPLLYWRTLFGNYRKDLRIFPHGLYFDTELNLVRAFIGDFDVPRNEEYESYFSNLKYQKWEGQNWSPWMGEIDENQ